VLQAEKERFVYVLYVHGEKERGGEGERKELLLRRKGGGLNKKYQDNGGEGLNGQVRIPFYITKGDNNYYNEGLGGAEVRSA